jgi:hypothetical protein
MMKYIFLAAALFFSTEAVADKLMAQHPASGGYEYPQQEARFLQLQPAPQTTTTMSDMMVDIFLEQGILGVMLLILGGYFYKTESLARTDRINLQNKLETLVERSQDNLVEVKTHLASLDARMSNLERETEGMKDYIFTKFKG